MYKAISLIVFLIGYVLISQEHVLRISKTAVSLLLAVILWIIAIASGQSGVEHVLTEAAAETFELVVFLLSAMTLVEILTHYGLFDFIYAMLLRLKLSDASQFVVLTFLTFVSSAFLDNLTTTIVFLQIARRFFRGKNLIVTSAAMVISANAGGAFSPIGDVTTTMLWLADKFDTSTIVLQGIAPSFAVYLVSILFLRRAIVTDTVDIVQKNHVRIGKFEWLIIGMCLLSFLLPVAVTRFHLPPYVGLLFGLGAVWFVVDAFRHRLPGRTSLMISIDAFFQKTDIASLFFFIGILLAVNALGHVGVLADMSSLLFEPVTSTKIITGSVVIGLLSALFDNIPLTAAAIDIITTPDARLWVFLAYAVGVGGSLLSIGSAPGIIAMSMVKELTFRKYLSIATLPALIAYAVGILVWRVQYGVW